MQKFYVLEQYFLSQITVLIVLFSGLILTKWLSGEKNKVRIISILLIIRKFNYKFLEGGILQITVYFNTKKVLFLSLPHET